MGIDYKEHRVYQCVGIVLYRKKEQWWSNEQCRTVLELLKHTQRLSCLFQSFPINLSKTYLSYQALTRRISTMFPCSMHSWPSSTFFMILQFKLYLAEAVFVIISEPCNSLAYILIHEENYFSFFWPLIIVCIILFYHKISYNLLSVYIFIPHSL